MQQHALVVHDMPIAQFRAKLKQLQDERHARVEVKRLRKWLEEQDTRSNTKANAAAPVCLHSPEPAALVLALARVCTQKRPVLASVFLCVCLVIVASHWPA